MLKNLNPGLIAGKERFKLSFSPPPYDTFQFILSFVPKKVLVYYNSPSTTVKKN